MIDPKMALETGSVVFGAENGTFAGGKQAQVGHGVASFLQIGGLTIRNLPVEVLDVSNFAAELNGEEICGVLGTNLLYHFVATIDYANGRLRLEPKGSHHSTGQAVRIWLAGDHYILAAGRIDRGSQQTFLIDSGLAGGGFLAPDATLEENGLIPSAALTTGQGGGGSVQGHLFVVKTLSLGPVKRHNITGFSGVFPAPLQHAFGTNIAGLVSHQFFRPYALLLDFDRMEMRVVHSGR